MATAVENLNKHLQLAVRQLKIISGTLNEIPLYIRTRRRNLRSVVVPDRDGIPKEMKGSEIVAALKGIVNTTSLNRKSYAVRRDNGNAHGGLNVTRGR